MDFAWLVEEYRQPFILGIATFVFAAFAVVHIVFEILRRRRERKEAVDGRIFVNAYEAGTVTMDCPPEEADEDQYILMIAVNDGKKVVTLQSVWLQVKRNKKHFMLKGENLFTARLEEGDEKQLLWDRNEVVKGFKKAEHKFPVKCRAVFVSNTRRLYTSKWFEVHEETAALE